MEFAGDLGAAVHRRALVGHRDKVDGDRAAKGEAHKLVLE